jgi:hypothetical protein
MQIKLLVPGLALAAAVAVTPAALAAKPPKPPKPPQPPNSAITIGAQPSIIVFSGTTTVSGRLGGNGAPGVTVRLEQDDSLPFGDSYKAAGKTATTANNSGYSFAVKPLVNTQYRVVAQTSPPVTSAGQLVRVRMLVGLRLSDTTPARGSLVKFSGSVFPAHDGRLVSIQRRLSTGGFATVTRTTLKDAGDAKSTYTRRVRVFRTGVYRVKVTGDADHANGFSRMRSVAVHG